MLPRERRIVESQFYQRQLQLPDFTSVHQQRLQQARVVVVGAGGLGVPALVTLAMSGVGKIGIVDGDSVAISNLHRQWLYTVEDVGKNKARVAAERLKQRNPIVHYEAVAEFLTPWNAEQLLTGYDLIIDGTDSIPIRYVINDVAYHLGKPVVYGAIYQYEGEFMVLNAPLSSGKYSPNYRDLYPIPPMERLVPTCSDEGVFAPITHLIGVCQATEAIKYIAGIGTVQIGTLVRVNLKTQQWLRFTVQEHPDNPLRRSDWYYDAAAYPQYCAVPEVSWDQVQKSSEALLLDIREPWEREQMSAGGLHIPLSRLRLEEIPMDRPVYIYCASGIRSARLVALLRQQGRQNVWNVRGGIAAWKVQQQKRRTGE